MGNSKRVICIGDVKIGGEYPIAIQSMTNTDTSDVTSTVNQILELEKAGCEIIRVAVPDRKAAKAVSKIKERIHIPLVCDIHFDHNLALMSIENGADKIRINPGNIGDESKVKEVVSAAKINNIPIRIGVNSGSLQKDLLDKYKTVNAKALYESAKSEVETLLKYDYENIAVSIKSSDVLMCQEAYKMFASKYDFPLHIGITEAGTKFTGAIKSAVGISGILREGIGDTIRVSLSADPVYEVEAAKLILESLGYRKPKVQIISCPTCGRTKIDLISLANKVNDFAKNLDKEIKIAVMGCVVNGPGEAREADIGIAGGDGKGVIFSKGEIIKTVPEPQLLDALKEEILKIG